MIGCVPVLYVVGWSIIGTALVIAAAALAASGNGE